MAKLVFEADGVLLDLKSEESTDFGVHVKRITTPHGWIKMTWNFDTDHIMEDEVEEDVDIIFEPDEDFEVEK